MDNKPNSDSGAIAKFLVKSIDRAIGSQQPLAVANVERLRRVHPDKTPKQLVAYVDRVYVGAVATTGAGAGAAAAVPNGVGQATAAVADFSAYLAASVLYVLSVAEIYGMHTEDHERRKALITVAFLGESAAKAVLNKVIPRTAGHWGKLIVKTFNRDLIVAINKALGPRFITLTGSKVGVLVIGKQAPLMIGAVLGAAGNSVFGWSITKSTKKMLGPVPADWSHFELSVSDPTEQ